jgi:hypothetical protein
MVYVNGTLTVEKDPQMATVKPDFSKPHIIQGMNTALQVIVEQEDPLVSFQTDVTFPDFVSVDLDNIALSNRCNNAHIISAVQVSTNPNTYRFLIYSPSNALIAGNSGTLFTIPMTVDWNVCPVAYRSYPVSTSATIAITYLSETEKPEKTLANTSSLFYTHKLGDANVDDRVSISDIVADVDYMLGRNPSPFLFDAGDMDANLAINLADLIPLSDTILVQSQSNLNYYYNEGFETGTNDWTIANGSQTNKWYWGTATAHSGSYSMYISNNSSANSYSTDYSSVVHFYRNITVGENDRLSFYWKGVGEGSYDYLNVYLVSTSTTPTAGNTVSNGYLLGTFYGSSSWQQAAITIPASQAGNKRLVFSWRNDGSAGSQPPVAIDDIVCTSLTSLPTGTATISAAFSNPNLVTDMNTDLLLTLDNKEPILAFQTDVTLPSFVSMDINNMVLSDRCDNSYIARAKRISSSPTVYRVHIYSTNNAPIAADSSLLIHLPLSVDWNAVSITYANYSVSTANTSAVFHLSETEKPERAIANASATFYTHRMGDVNINGTVTFSDIVAEVDYILGKNPQPFLFEAGDMNSNNAISLLDLTRIVNVVLTQGSASSALYRDAARRVSTDVNADYELSLSNLELDYSQGVTTGNMILSMRNVNPVIALNWDLTLPENVTIDENNLAFAGERTNRNKHTIAVNKLAGSNTWRFVVYSSQNREITGSSGELIAIPLVINEETATGQFSITPSAANLIYSENGVLDETTPACTSGILTNEVEIGGTNVLKIESEKLKVYPNPVKHDLFIKSDAPIERVELYNQVGALVRIETDVTEKIDVSPLADGLYLARIYSGNQVIVRKVIVKK